MAARRAAREEARVIRMKELERQQREMEEKQDRIYELTRESGVSTQCLLRYSHRHDVVVLDVIVFTHFNSY